MERIIFDGRLTVWKKIAASQLLRGLYFGDGFFESMKYAHTQLCFAQDHWERMERAFRILELDNPFPSCREMEAKIHELCSLSADTASARVRIQCWRAGEGTYMPQTHSCHYLVTAAYWPEETYIFHEKGLALGLFTGQLKSTSTLSTIKSSGSLVSILAGAAAAKEGKDEMVLFNSPGRPVESATSNIFLVIRNTLITPPLSEGCLDGVMRKNILRFAEDLQIPMEERPLELTDFHSAAEVFITNALRGVRWVAAVGEHIYTENKTARRMQEVLNNTIKSP